MKKIIKKIWNYIKSIPKRHYNFFLCLRYPFYKLRNVWTDKFSGYEYTWYDFIPEGWRKAFGKKLSEDLREQLKEEGSLYTFRFTDIKEKNGSLCLYNNGATQETLDILEYYEDISECYCINCGDFARITDDTYLTNICEKCYEKLIKKIK